MRLDKLFEGASLLTASRKEKTFEHCYNLKMLNDRINANTQDDVRSRISWSHLESENMLYMLGLWDEYEDWTVEYEKELKRKENANG